MFLNSIFKKVFLSFAVFACMSTFCFAQTANKKYLKFTDLISAGHSTSIQSEMPTKAERNSSTKGFISLYFDDAVPDSMRIALTAAKEYWESKIPIQQEVIICAEMASLDSDVATEVYAGYSEDVSYYGYPTALVSQLSGDVKGTIESPDGIIYINSNKQWNCSFSNNSSEGLNVYTMGLRSIAITFGFGSSILQYYDDQDRKYKYIFGCIAGSSFDKRISNGINFITDFQEGSQELEDFITSENIYVKGQNDEYHLYSSNPFIQSKSLVYLDEPTSLMHYNIGDGDKFFTIDNITIDILNGLGWNIQPSSDVSKIKCNNIGDDGIGSAYTSHTFSLQTSSASQYNWKFYLKNSFGNYTLTSSGTNSTFTIPEITSTENYYINLNGDIEGRIECEYTVNGKTNKAKPFSVSLELKPTILSVDNVMINQIDDDLFMVSFTVQYRGADYIAVGLEVENDPVLAETLFKEPFLAHVTTGRLSIHNNNWVHIRVYNKYGEVIRTLEFLRTTDAEMIYTNLDVNEIMVYSIFGEKMYSGKESDFDDKLLQPGVYIKRNNSDLSTVKIINR